MQTLTYYRIEYTEIKKYKYWMVNEQTVALNVAK